MRGVVVGEGELDFVPIADEVIAGDFSAGLQDFGPVVFEAGNEQVA